MRATAPPTTHKNGNRIPRPANKFILWRTNFLKSPENLTYLDDLRKETGGRNSTHLSKLWRQLSAGELDFWACKAKEEERRHKEMYPGWVYQPRTKRTSAGDAVESSAPTIKKPRSVDAQHDQRISAPRNAFQLWSRNQLKSQKRCKELTAFSKATGFRTPDLLSAIWSFRSKEDDEVWQRAARKEEQRLEKMHERCRTNEALSEASTRSTREAISLLEGFEALRSLPACDYGPYQQYNFGHVASSSHHQVPTIPLMDPLYWLSGVPHSAMDNTPQVSASSSLASWSSLSPLNFDDSSTSFLSLPALDPIPLPTTRSLAIPCLLNKHDLSPMAHHAGFNSTAHHEFDLSPAQTRPFGNTLLESGFPLSHESPSGGSSGDYLAMHSNDPIAPSSPSSHQLEHPDCNSKEDVDTNILFSPWSASSSTDGSSTLYADDMPTVDPMWDYVLQDSFDCTTTDGRESSGIYTLHPAVFTPPLTTEPLILDNSIHTDN